MNEHIITALQDCNYDDIYTFSSIYCFIKFYDFLLLILHPKGHVAHVPADVSGRQSQIYIKKVLPSFNISILCLKCLVSFCIFPRNDHGTRGSVPFSDT